MAAWRVLPYLLVTLVVVGCREELAPEGSPQPEKPQLAQGGVPGPPPGVIVPTPPGLGRVPRPLPPGAGPPSFLSNIIAIGAGNRFSCALRTDGLAYCWGAAILGDGSSVGSSVPVEVSGPNRFVRLAVGDLSACGLTAAGDAWCWGDNSQGQLGAGLSAPFALTPVPVAGGHKFVQLDLGLRGACGIAADGVTYCWGSNQLGQLGIGHTGGQASAPVAVVGSAALGFVSVDMGFVDACGRVATGQLYCWGLGWTIGNGSNAPASVPTPTLAAGGATFASVSVGAIYSCALDGSGAASCWGQQASGELGNGTTTTLALDPTAVVGGLSFTLLDASDNNSFSASTCGIETSGDAWCWGSNALGQLGAPSGDTCGSTYSCSASPVKVSGGVTFQDVAVGVQHTCGLDLAGNVWCWGGNTGGELGDGTMVNSGTPVRTAGLTVAQQDGWIEITPLPSAPLRLIGTTQQFTAVAFDENGVPRAAQPAFAWTSSDPAVATVDATGLATAIATGGVTITATAPDGTSARVGLGVQIVDPVAVWQDAWAGGSSAGLGATDGIVVLSGLLADEWVHSGTFGSLDQIDRRSIASNNVGVEQTFQRLAFARIALEHDAARLKAADPTDPAIGKLLTLAGYVYLAFAENFCSGVPLDDPDVGISTDSLFRRGLWTFVEARNNPMSLATWNMTILGAIRGGMGLGNAGALGTMPTTFAFGSTYSTAPGDQNQVWALNVQQHRLSLADLEGGSGLPFRGANDPRVPWTFSGLLGQDNITPSYILSKYPDAAASIALASGVEARLMAAENALRSGNVTGMLDSLNNLRAAAPTLGLLPLPALQPPADAAAAVDMLFAERAFWLFGDGHRLGDLRRRARFFPQPGQSGPALPTGPYHKGGSYGTDANLPVPLSARGPAYSDCLVRDR